MTEKNPVFLVFLVFILHINACYKCIYNSKATRTFSVSLHIYHVKTLRHTVKIAASFSYIKISHGLNVHLNAV